MVHGHTRGGSRAPDPQDSSPPPLWGTPKLQKEGKKTLRVCTRIHRVLVPVTWNPPTLSEILYPPLHTAAKYQIPVTHVNNQG